MKKTIAISVLTLAYSIFFYHQRLGVNVFIFSLFAIGLYYYIDKDAFTTKSALFIIFGVFASSVFVFINNSTLSVWTWLVSLLLIPGVMMNKRSTIIIDLISSISSIVLAPVYMIIELVQANTEEKSKDKRFLRALKYIIPIFFIIIFFFIYRAMNPLFERLTQEIANLISVEWFFFAIGGFILCYAFYKQYRSKNIDDWEKGWQMQLTQEEQKEPKWNEGSAFIILFVALNIMLVMVNFMDVNYLYLGQGMPDGITHKEFVHKGVGMLIFSILLGIIILLYFFRGYLNFSKHQSILKILAFLWVAQNVFMVFSTSIRNTMYIDAALLTYKRIGVYFWLLFALLGLITLFIKLHKNKSVWYLARHNFTILYIVMLLSSVFDWDMILSNYNVYRAKKKPDISSLDKNYLLSISEGNIKELFDLKKIEGFEVDSVYSYRGFGTYQLTNASELDFKVYRFLADDIQGDWRSYSLRRDRVKKDIQQLDNKGELVSMNLENAHIKKIEPFSKLKNLKELNLTGCPINDWENIESLKGVTDLSVSYLTKKDIDFFQNLNTLKVLTVSMTDYEVKEQLKEQLKNVVII